MNHTLITVLEAAAAECLAYLQAANNGNPIPVSDLFLNRRNDDPCSFDVEQNRAYIADVYLPGSLAVRNAFWNTYANDSYNLIFTCCDLMLNYKPIRDMFMFNDMYTRDLDEAHPVFEDFAALLGQPSRSLYILPSNPSPSVEPVPVLGFPAQCIKFRDGAAPYTAASVRFTPATHLWKVREAARAKVREPRFNLSPSVLQYLPNDVIATQFPHMASKEGNLGLIAFTQNPEAGERDRQQVIKPGRYIKQHCPEISDQALKELTASINMNASKYEVHFSNEETMFEHVYTNGPSSCMSYKVEDKWGSRMMVDGQPYHPTRIYAHPENNISIAWIENRDGQIIARALVNTKKEQFARIYAREYPSGLVQEMHEALEAIGYRSNEHALSGEKIQRVALDNYPDSIVCPYIDPSNMGVYIRDDHLIIDGDESADHSTGCLTRFGHNRIDYWSCSCCGDDIDRDEDPGTYVETEDETVCESCLENVYVYAWQPSRYGDGNGGYVRDSSSDLFGSTHMSLEIRRGYNWVYDPDHRLSRLTEGLYDDDECITDMDVIEIADEDGDGTDEYMRECDMDSHDYVNVEGAAIHRNNVVYLDGELIPTGALPDDEAVQENGTRNGITCYITRGEDTDTEEKAA